MNKSIKAVSLAFVLAIVSCFAHGAYAQSTSSVVMAKWGDVIRKSLPTATNYFVKEVALGQDEVAKIKLQGSFSPQVSRMKFFYGKDTLGGFVGTVLFDEVKTIHGPVEVGIAFTPGGTVSNVVVTKATAETEPWVKAALSSGLVKNYIGMSAKSMTNPLQNVSPASIGEKPYLMAQAITSAVTQGVVYYNVLFQPRLPQ